MTNLTIRDGLLLSPLKRSPSRTSTYSFQFLDLMRHCLNATVKPERTITSSCTMNAATPSIHVLMRMANSSEMRKMTSSPVLLSSKDVDLRLRVYLVRMKNGWTCSSLKKQWATRLLSPPL